MGKGGTNVYPLLSVGQLVIPKCKLKKGGQSDSVFLTLSFVDHAEFFHQVPEDYLADLLPLAKKVAVAQGFEQYNLLQVSARSLP